MIGNETNQFDPVAIAAAQRKLAEPSIGLSVAAEVRTNVALSEVLLREKVLGGRERQNELTEKLREQRSQGEDSRQLTELGDQRRLCHVATVLSRAELLVRQAPSLSRYQGDEAKFDDLTILERAIGFAKLELQSDTPAADRAELAHYLQVLQDAERRVESTDY